METHQRAEQSDKTVKRILISFRDPAPFSWLHLLWASRFNSKEWEPLGDGATRDLVVGATRQRMHIG